MVPPSTQERLRGHLEGHRKWVEDMAAAEALLKPCPAEILIAYPVSTRVNKVANDDPGVIEPLEEEGTPPSEPQGHLL